MSSPLRHQVGQLIIAGLEGTELTSVERAWLKLIRPGGVILFRRNIEQAGQTVQLLNDATGAIGSPAFRCIDLEGGLVDRLRDLIAPMPSSAAVFASGKRSHFKKHGHLIGKEARILGLNTVFAPVLDLALQESSSVMRTRVVSPHASEVTRYAEAFLQGLTSQRILGCGKHFPGLGGGNLDSHHAMPVIERAFTTMWEEDIVPFRELAGQLPMVMVSHASYPHASGKSLPASVSAFWITNILRKKLRFRGLVVSDDMEMGGILTQMPIEDAAIEAVLAGTDLLEICRDPSLILSAYEALLSEAEHSPFFRLKIQGAVRRIERSKKRQSFTQTIPRPNSKMLEQLRAEIETFEQQVNKSRACINN